MQYIKFTYVTDPQTQGPVYPAVQGLVFVWARESQYPTNNPEFFGTADDDADLSVEGVLGVYSQDDWELMREDEMLARRPIAPASCTPAQGLVALYAQKGITEDQLLQAIENIPDAVQKYTVRIGFQRAITWERYSQSTQVMAQLLQLTEEDLDSLFEFAVTVTV